VSYKVSPCLKKKDEPCVQISCFFAATRSVLFISNASLKQDGTYMNHPSLAFESGLLSNLVDRVFFVIFRVIKPSKYV